MSRVENQDIKWASSFNFNHMRHIRGYQIYTIVIIGLNVLHIPHALVSHEFIKLDRNKVKCHVIIAWHHCLSILVSCILEIWTYFILQEHYNKSHSAIFAEVLQGLEGCGGENFGLVIETIQE